MIRCKICGEIFKYSKGKFKPKRLFQHIGRLHKIKNYEYVKKYEETTFKFEKCGWCNRDAIPDIVYEDKKLRLEYTKYLCDNDHCKKERKKYNPRSYYATEKTYKMSTHEAKEYVSNKSPFHRNFFKSDEEYTKAQSNVSLEQFQKRHGKREGLKKFQEYQNLRRYMVSLPYYIEQYGEELGLEKWEKLNKSKAITREKMISKYGELKGHKKYESFLDKTLKNFVSTISIECLDYISKECNIQIRHGKNNSEKKIRCLKSTRPVDGFCKDLNIVFEFYGDKWHMNPILFNSEDLNPRRKKALDVWKEDRIRLNDILSEVNAVFIIWEYDWKHNAQRVIERIKKLLLKLQNEKLDQSVYFL